MAAQRLSQQKLKQNYDKKQLQKLILLLPTYNCNLLMNKLYKWQKRIGLETSLLFLVLTAVLKLNFMSLIYMVLVYICIVYYKKQQKGEESGKYLLNVWKYIQIILASDILIIFLLKIWFPQQWNIFPPWKDWDFVCNTESKNVFSKLIEFKNQSDFVTCIQNYRHWFGLENVDDIPILIEFIAFYLFAH